MNWLSRVIAHHPYLVLSGVSVFSLTCLIIPLTTLSLPDFSDPALGFESRGTQISDRLIAWENLQEAIRLTGPLSVNPELSRQIIETSKQFAKEGGAKEGVGKTGQSLNEISSSPAKTYYSSHNISFIVEPSVRRNYSSAEDDSEEDWESLKKELGRSSNSAGGHSHPHLSADRFFCSSPGPGYARVVMSSWDGSDLYTHESILAMCSLQASLTSMPEFHSLCETSSPRRCCPAWSLPNYLAMLYNRTTCLDITSSDVLQSRALLDGCLRYYSEEWREHLLTADQLTDIPTHCSRHHAVYFLKHYILDFEYLNSSFPLKNVMVLLPIAKSSAALEFYRSLTERRLQEGNIRISAMDLGLKKAVFDEYLVRDTRLLGLGALFVLLCVCTYTGSLLFTLSVLLGVFFSLGISYFVYSLLLEITFFPFMNLLAIVVAIGIGGDSALMIEKAWSCGKDELTSCGGTAEGPVAAAKGVSSVLRHTSLPMLASALSTALAFYSSYISSISAIAAFSVFAGTTVLANLAVMLLWTPACLVINDRIPSLIRYPKLPDVRSHLFLLVLRYRTLWLLLFSALSLGSVCLLLSSTSRLFPDSPGLQLLAASHPFEQYDSIYRERFLFERTLKTEFDWTNQNIKMPLRFVWGVMAEDSGNRLEPASRGELQLDRGFDLASPDSQAWLVSFCTKLRAQEFYQQRMGPLLPNCFLETFSGWMERKCADPIDGLSRYPCCEAARFPYERKVFSQCAGKAAAALYRTPASLASPSPAGPKFAVKSKAKYPRIKALVVEYDSNYSLTTSFKEMQQFFNQVENWTVTEMDSAPAGMRGGWFVSYLSLYSLQKSLFEDTAWAVLLSTLTSFLVVAGTTLDLTLSVMACVTILSVISVSLATLLLLGWRLNILEAVSVCLTIGLAVDFTMAYLLHYRMAADKRSREGRVNYALSMMSGPIFLAALTTAGVGTAMLSSSVLPYHQIGVLMVVLMCVSWSYATLFLLPALSLFGPTGGETGGRGELNGGGTRSSSLELGTLGGRTSAPGGGRQRKAENSPSATSAVTIVEGESMLHPT